MTGTAFERLEDVILDPIFPEVDVALRAGRHIDREDADGYGLLLDAQELLEPLYRRYGCELIHATDGYFYLLPTGDQLGRRHLTAGEMLVGQTLALLYLEPATLQAGGVVRRSELVSRLAGLVGDRDLVAALNPRRRGKYDERVAHETVRLEIARALRGLAGLGFVELVNEDGLRPRAPVLRFADPVRGLGEPAEALERLVSSGRIALGLSNGDSNGNGEDEA